MEEALQEIAKLRADNEAAEFVRQVTVHDTHESGAQTEDESKNVEVSDVKPDEPKIQDAKTDGILPLFFRSFLLSFPFSVLCVYD